ncbi:hypothetical protein BDV97DRAFT_413177 [Delphinella strobiligena]|nr:hypothetical protein BDV97DRAFT_413177 [Delphinella strobiligena]
MMICCRTPRASRFKSDFISSTNGIQHQLSSSSSSEKENVLKTKRRGNPEALRRWTIENPNVGPNALRKWHWENPGMATEILRKWRRENPDARSARARKDISKDLEAQNGLQNSGERTEEVTQMDLLKKPGFGIFHVTRIMSNKKTGKLLYEFRMGILTFRIPKRVATLWDMDRDSEKDLTVHVRVDVTQKPHNHMWAEKAIDADAGSRVAIQIRYKDFEPVWLHNRTGSGIPVANSLADWVDGRIHDAENFDWKAHRYPILGTMRSLVSMFSWNRTHFNDPDKRKTIRSEAVRNHAKWILTPRAKKAFDELRKKVENEEDVAVVDYAFRHLDEFGYIPAGLFTRTQCGGLTVGIRPEALAIVRAKTQLTS